METVVLDPGLEGEGTHHLNLMLAIHSAIEKAVFRSESLASED